MAWSWTSELNAARYYMKFLLRIWSSFHIIKRKIAQAVTLLSFLGQPKNYQKFLTSSWWVTCFLIKGWETSCLNWQWCLRQSHKHFIKFDPVMKSLTFFKLLFSYYSRPHQFFPFTVLMMSTLTCPHKTF